MTFYVTKLSFILDVSQYIDNCKVDNSNSSEFRIEIKDESMEDEYYHIINESSSKGFSWNMKKFLSIQKILNKTKLNDERLKIYPCDLLDFQARFPELSFDKITHLNVIITGNKVSNRIHLSAPFKSLKSLYFNSVTFSCDLYRDIMEMKDLRIMHLSNIIELNKFPDFFDNLDMLRNLNELKISFQKLNIDFMKGIYKCSNLTQLEFSNIDTLYPIDKRIHDLVNLDKLSLSGVSATNDVLTYIEKLSKLKFLELRENQIDCELPTSLDLLTELEHLEICNNEIKGEIPKCLGNMIKLKHLDLWENNLTGKIPENFKNLVNLKYFRLAENSFDKQNMPCIFSEMKDLEHVDLMLSNLTGTIGDQFINNIKLKVFNIAENEIENMPDYIRNIKGINIEV